MKTDRLVQELAADVDQAWRVHRYREDAFPEVAAECLSRARLHERVAPEDILASVLHNASPPRGTHASKQVVPLLQSQRFFITAHFWTDEVGNAHSHRWGGAFQMLSGSVCHALYDFSESWRQNARLRFGTLSLNELDYCSRGAVLPIKSGLQTIHSLCHVERTSMSLTIRSMAIPDEVTLNYWRPGVAAELYYEDAMLAPKLRCLEVLARTDPAKYLTHLGLLLETADVATAFYLLEHGVLLFDDRDAILELAGHAEARFETTGRTPPLVLALEDELRFNCFEQARRDHRDNDTRFALAAMYLARNVEDIVHLARVRWSSSRPERRISAALAPLLARRSEMFGPGDAASLHRIHSSVSGLGA